jgi:uncharacterized protein YukE
MSFSVYPPALRSYARKLAEAEEAAKAAKHYFEQHGTFSRHEKGILGTVLPAHMNFVANLDGVLTHLAQLLDASKAALEKTAAQYEQVDLRAAGAADASYPAVARPAPSRD